MTFSSSQTTSPAPRRTVLISFGSRGYEGVLARLKESARDFFDEIILYSEEDIDRQFYISNCRIFQLCRGWGYWLWKPWLIAYTLRQLQNGDCCFYLDATGRFLSSPSVLIDLCIQNDGILLFSNSKHRNGTWTKADCFNLMGLAAEKYYDGFQADAAVQVYCKNQRSMEFLDELISYATNYHIITDAPNITGENRPEFRDHRHDQSILSLLAIKHDIPLQPSPRKAGNYTDIPSSCIIELKRDVNKPAAFYKLFPPNPDQ